VQASLASTQVELGCARELGLQAVVDRLEERQVLLRQEDAALLGLWRLEGGEVVAGQGGSIGGHGEA
jgi:hypothetical protein